LGLIPVLCLVALAARAEDATKDLKALQGTWQLVELATDKGPAPADRIKGVKFTVAGEKLVMDGLDGKRAFAIKLDPTVKPKSIDLTPLDGPFKGKTTLGLYEVSGDTFRLCMANHEIKARPKELKPMKEGQVFVFVLKRPK
jgi:uncharacterized protein (TIGR03067 family)